ncbi:Phosphoenolpyruvate/pyruvate domain-containing protein [Ramicandelaber brevisporus]|nr:Phosphoenolpyruvate/pyruvate domain-containing protein [Ramicandelaber brevisporus]
MHRALFSRVTAKLPVRQPALLARSFTVSTRAWNGSSASSAGGSGDSSSASGSSNVASAGAGGVSASRRMRRALLYVPGIEDKVRKSLALRPDTLIYDLEDSVPLSRKGAARQVVFDALTLRANESSNKTTSTSSGGALAAVPELGVRINAIGSGLELDDLQIVLQSRHLNVILIPKVQSARDISFVSRAIDLLAPAETRSSIKLVASIESALGVMNIREIASADPRVDALLFAAEDYCADLGLIRSRSLKEMLYARSAVVTAAHAYGLQAIDLVCMDFKDKDVLAEECRGGRGMGFTGKQAIHPAQIETIHGEYAPSKAEIIRAKRIVDGYASSSRRGIGAFDLDGKAIDMPVVKWAEKILANASAAGIDVAAVVSQGASGSNASSTNAAGTGGAPQPLNPINFTSNKQ